MRPTSNHRRRPEPKAISAKQTGGLESSTANSALSHFTRGALIKVNLDS
jgi:hypothetical protein